MCAPHLSRFPNSKEPGSPDKRNSKISILVHFNLYRPGAYRCRPNNSGPHPGGRRVCFSKNVSQQICAMATVLARLSATGDTPVAGPRALHFFSRSPGPGHFIFFAVYGPRAQFAQWPPCSHGYPQPATPRNPRSINTCTLKTHALYWKNYA